MRQWIGPAIHLLGILIMAAAAGVVRGAATATEFCEDEKIDTQVCPLRPSISSILNRPHNEAYLVCEDDILPPCTETVNMEDQQESATQYVHAPQTTATTISPSKPRTAASTTSSAPTQVTTIRTAITDKAIATMQAITIRMTSPKTATAEVCPLCVTTCVEERSRCDQSESRLTSPTTIDVSRIVIKSAPEQETTPKVPLPIQKNQEESTAAATASTSGHVHPPKSKSGEFSFGVYDRRHGHEGEGLRTAATATHSGAAHTHNHNHTYGFPKILFDTFKKQPLFQNVKTFGEIRDQLHRIKYGGGDGDKVEHTLGSRRIRRSTSAEDRLLRRDLPPNGYQMNPADEQKLSNLYGQETFDRHRTDLVDIGNMRQQNEALQHDDHLNPPFHNPSIPDDEIQQRVDQVRLNMLQQRQNHQFVPPPPPPPQGQQEIPHHWRGSGTAREPVSQPEIRRLLQELLVRLEAMEGEQPGRPQPQRGPMLRPPQPQLQLPPPSDRCTLHGLWLSAITGIGIQLEPISEHEVRLHVVDLGKYTEGWAGQGQGEDQQYEHYISSDWTGRAVVSTESATTISIILQEKWINHESEPRTAVFVGQCVICSGSPTIQGTWIMFPESQTCFEEISTKVPSRSDVMYLLK